MSPRSTLNGDFVVSRRKRRRQRCPPAAAASRPPPPFAAIAVAAGLRQEAPQAGGDMRQRGAARRRGVSSGVARPFQCRHAPPQGYRSESVPVYKVFPYGDMRRQNSEVCSVAGSRCLANAHKCRGGEPSAEGEAYTAFRLFRHAHARFSSAASRHT